MVSVRAGRLLRQLLFLTLALCVVIQADPEGGGGSRARSSYLEKAQATVASSKEASSRMSDVIKSECAAEMTGLDAAAKAMSEMGGAMGGGRDTLQAALQDRVAWLGADAGPCHGYHAPQEHPVLQVHVGGDHGQQVGDVPHDPRRAADLWASQPADRLFEPQQPPLADSGSGYKHCISIRSGI